MPIDSIKTAVTGGAQRAFVKFGVFGKHPGWADHIRDESKQTFGLSLDSPAMLQLFDFLYNAGIHRNMDVWKNRLQDAQRLSGFDHLILWRSGPADWLLVRLWPSRDTSGRADFPMAAVVHAHGLPATTALVALCEKLEAARQTLTDCATAADVIASVARINTELSAELARWTDDVASPVGDAATALCKDPAFVADEASLVSVVVRIDSALQRRRSAGKQTAAAPEHLRLPVHGASPAAALQGWTELLAARTAGQEELFAAVALSQRWVDVIIGRPSVESLVCLRASDEYLPVATDVRFTGEPQQQASASAFVTQLSNGQVSMPKGAASGPVGVARPQGTIGQSGLDRKTLLLIAAVAFALIVTILVVVMLLLSGGGKQESSATPASSSSGSSSSSSAATPAPSPALVSRSDPSGGAPAASQLKNPSWDELCNAYSGWVSVLVSDVADLSEETRATLHQDPHIHRWLDSVTAIATQADPRLVAGQRAASISGLLKNPPASVRTPQGITKTNEAIQSLRTLQADLGEDKWPAMKRTIAVAKAMDERGFKTIAATLTAATNLRDETGAIVLDHVAKIIALQPQIQAAEDAWSALTARAKVLSQTGDLELTQYLFLAKTSAAGASDLPQLAIALNDVLKAGEPIEAFVLQTYNNDELFDKIAFEKRIRAQKAEPFGIQMLSTWLRVASQYCKLTSDPRGKPDRWSNDLSGVAAQLKLITDVPAAKLEAQLIRGRLEQVQGQVPEIWKIAPLAKNRVELTEQTAAIDENVAALVRDVRKQVALHTVDPGPWLKGMRETESISRSAAIDGAWRRGRDAILAGVSDVALKADPTKLPALQDRIKTMRESLEPLDSDKTFPLLTNSIGDASWQTKIREEAGRERERALAMCVKALPGVNEGKPTADDVTYIKARDESVASYREWVKSFEAKLKLAQRLELAMHSARLLSEPIDKSDPTTVGSAAASLLADPQMAWMAADEQALSQVKALLAIVNIATTDRSTLVVRASGKASESLSVRRAAWLALGEPSPQRWPANLQELQTERDLSVALARALDNRLSTAKGEMRGVDPRLDGLKEELASQSRERWERAFVAINGRDDLFKARDTMASMSVDETRLAGTARYRLSLLSLTEKIAAARAEKADDEKMRSIIDTFARGLLPELRSTEPAKKLLTKLAELTDSQKSGGKAASLGNVGPGARGWKAQASTDGDSVVYTHPSAPLRVEFIRVASGGRDTKACYLAATELSVSQFLQACIDAGDASREWVSRWDLGTSQDFRRGPRVWDLDDAGIKIASSWLNEKASAGAADTSGPGPDQPMQWLSPKGATDVAAALGCRLPTFSEWSAAAKSQQNAQQDSQTNLRDKRYKDEIARAAGVPGLTKPWPADGIFRPAGERVAASADGKLVTDIDDGTLWFTPVGAPSNAAAAIKESARFWHLRGNVAEYVLSQQHADQSSAPEVMVIGESALSPPRQSPDQALPIANASASRGYSDVGVRLAFDAPFEPLTASVAKLLASDDVWGFAGKTK